MESRLKTKIYLPLSLLTLLLISNHPSSQAHEGKLLTTKPIKLFKQIDINDDSKISLDEFKKHHLNEQRVEQHFQHLDSNNEENCNRKKVNHVINKTPYL